LKASTERDASRRDITVLISIFVISRFLATLAGVRLNTAPLQGFLQYLDPTQLKTNLAQSLWYLHTQPPLYNAILGVLLKISGPTLLIPISHFLIGLTGLIGLHYVCKSLDLGRAVSVIIPVLFFTSPAAILYENLLFYPYLITVLLISIAYALTRSERSRVWSVTASVLFISVAFIWSLFHLLWLAVIAILLWKRNSGRYRAVLAPAVVATVLLYTKNLILFGFFGATSWMGMNLAGMTITPLSQPDRAALVARGEISDVSAKGPFLSLAKYGTTSKETTGVPVLDEPLRSSGAPNYNHLAYIEISRKFLRDDLAVLVDRPGIYLRSVFHSLFHFASPSSRNSFNEANLERIGVYDPIYNAVIYGDLFATPASGSGIGYRLQYLLSGPLFSFLYLPLALVYAFKLLWKRGTHSPAIIFAAATFLYVAVFGNLVETGENNRFKFVVEPFAWIMLAHWISGRTKALKQVR
jgi:hypothetical protein